jgi:hypothetical protein
MSVMDLVKHAKAYGTSILTVGLAIAAITVGSSTSYAQRNSLEQYTGIWEVDEIGGFLVSDRKGYWEIKQSGESLNILIPGENLTFQNVVPRDFKIRTSEERPAEDDTSLEKYTLDILFSETSFRGMLETPGANYEVTGELTSTYRQYRKELTKLRKFRNSASGQIATLVENNDALEGAKSSLQAKLEKTKRSLIENQMLLDKKKHELETTKKSLGAKIKAVKKAAPQIDVGSLRRSYRVRFPAELKSAPKKQARSYLKLSANEPVIYLVQIPRSDWAFIATSKGKLGYIKAASLEEVRGSNPPPIVRPTAPNKGPTRSSSPPANKAIIISEPSWDPGQEGRRMTVAAAGFLTLSGTVKTSQPVQSLKINQKPETVSRDGRFQTFLNISSSQPMEIVAVLLDGRSVKLTFDLVVRSP